jgi:hypothetical protein
MTQLVTLIAIVGALLALAMIFKRRPKATLDAAPYYATRPLSQPEQVLYYRLIDALPECMILAQVQLSRFLKVRKGANFGLWHNKVNRLSADFLVCLKDSTIVAVIELDDQSHERPDRRDADVRKSAALKAAGIPLVRWSVSAIPDKDEIRRAFTK